MATAVLTEQTSIRGNASGADDPFHDPLMLGIGIAFVVVAIGILTMTCLFMWGSMYHMPSWGAGSFPPPIVH
jgi:hypothetical protein